MNTISPNFYSPMISNIKLNPQKPYTINMQSIDSIQKVGEVTDKNVIPAKMLLSLMKSGLNGEKTDPKLFVGRSYEDWVRMYNMSHDNAVMPLVYEGIKNTPDIKVPDDVKANMEINAQFTKDYHTKQEAILKKFTEMTASKGVDTVQMKGVGFSMNYPNPQGRFGGDIDVFNFKHGTNPANPENNMSFFVDKLANKSNMNVDLGHGPKHSEIRYKGMPIENHRNFLNVEVSPLHKKMNNYLLKVFNPQQQTLPHGTKILVPSKEFNNIFISFHAMQHFIGSGLNFHHLADWAVQIKKHGMKVPEEAKGTKFEEFMYAFTNLANKHLGTNVKVPENKKLENAIFKRMLHPELELGDVKRPNKKTPINMLIYKYKKMAATHAFKKEFLGAEVGSFSQDVIRSIISHIKNPKTFINLFTKF